MSLEVQSPSVSEAVGLSCRPSPARTTRERVATSQPRSRIVPGNNAPRRLVAVVQAVSGSAWFMIRNVTKCTGPVKPALVHGARVPSEGKWMKLARSPFLGPTRPDFGRSHSLARRPARAHSHDTNEERATLICRSFSFPRSYPILGLCVRLCRDCCALPRAVRDRWGAASGGRGERWGS